MVKTQQTRETLCIETIPIKESRQIPGEQTGVQPDPIAERLAQSGIRLAAIEKQLVELQRQK